MKILASLLKFWQLLDCHAWYFLCKRCQISQTFSVVVQRWPYSLSKWKQNKYHQADLSYWGMYNTSVAHPLLNLKSSCSYCHISWLLYCYIVVKVKNEEKRPMPLGNSQPSQFNFGPYWFLSVRTFRNFLRMFCGRMLQAVMKSGCTRSTSCIKS